MAMLTILNKNLNFLKIDQILWEKDKNKEIEAKNN